MNKRIAWISIIVIFIISATALLLRPLWNPSDGKPGSKSQTYHKAHAYALTYPKGWHIFGGDEISGYEILSIYSYNYQKVDPGSGFSGGQIKIALSILDRPQANEGQQSLEQIVKSEFKGTERDFSQKALTINGRQAIRVTAVLENEESLSPVIETFIEYKDHQYAWLVGYHDGSQSAVAEIVKIQDSFQVLQ